METIRRLHEQALSAMTELVTTTAPAALSRPTPCAEWDVRQLIEHAVGLNRGFATALAHGDAPDAAFAPRRGSEWDDSASAIRQVVRSVPLDREVRVAVVHPTAGFAAEAVLGMHLLDLAVHGWDLAVATDRASQPSPAVVEALLPQARRIAGLERSGPVEAQFGAALPPAGADGTDRSEWSVVLRLLGRDPEWSGARLSPWNSPRPS